MSRRLRPSCGQVLLATILGIAFVVALAAVAVVGFLGLRYRQEAAREKSESVRLQEENKNLGKNIAEKERALLEASRKNFQQDLLVAQAALKAANEKMNIMIREKSGVENSSIILDNRLKNTTMELTRTLEELKKAREALSGIEGQYKIKMDQLSAGIKIRDDQIAKIQEKIKEKEALAEAHAKRQKDIEDLLRKHQMKAADLEKSIAALNRTVADKEKLIVQKDAEIEKRKKEAQGQPQKAKTQESESRITFLEREKAQLERQVSEASAKLFDQQEALKSFEETVATLKKELGERETALLRRGDEIRQKTRDIEALKEEVKNLRGASSGVSRSMPLLSETQRELEEKIARLEEDKKLLEARLSRADRSGAPGKGTLPDPFLDRNFRVLTEALVKKEEQIKEMETELESLRAEKQSREGGVDLKEKRLAELEILVTTLTRQLGDYASLITQKDAELKAGAVKIASLMQDVEAQKIAALALQKELAEAKVKQEKTFANLTQLLSINAGTSLPPNSPAASSAVMAEEDAAAAGARPALEEAAGEVDVQKRVKELRRRVEVLLEPKK